MELETARLRLRPLTPADGDGLFAILGDRETMAYSFPMIRGESDRFLEQSLLRRDPPVATPWRRRAARPGGLCTVLPSGGSRDV